MFSDDGLSLEQGTTSRGRGVGPWPWPVYTRLLLALFTLIAGVALCVAAHSAGCDARTASRVVPVLVIDPTRRRPAFWKPCRMWDPAWSRD